MKISKSDQKPVSESNKEADQNTIPEDPTNAGSARNKYSDVMGWISSFLVHMLLLFLALVLTVPRIGEDAILMLTSTVGPDENLDEDLDMDTSVEFESLETITDLTTVEPIEVMEVEVTEVLDTSAAPPMPSLDSVMDSSMMTSTIDSSSNGAQGTGTDGRSGESKAALVATNGGTAGSEEAVARGLKWIAKHQYSHGAWSLVHNKGECNGRCGNPGTLGSGGYEENLIPGTGLALLPFLGAGETHQKGEYKQNIKAGLRELISMAEENRNYAGASWSNNPGTMYSQAIAAIVLTEAYGITGDRKLFQPAQAAVKYIIDTQDPMGGGWRYSPRAVGDVSATGWQIMALKSASLAGIKVPRRTSQLAVSFLDSVQTHGGSRYRYLPNEKDKKEKPALTSVGLLSRLYTGWDKEDPRLAKGVKYLANKGPNRIDYYHNYYASQVIFHYTGGEGPVWERWNEKMREQLIKQQKKEGHQAGSWWHNDSHNKRGGRLYTTAMATMTLEVYYRYLPIFKSEAVMEDFPE